MGLQARLKPYDPKKGHVVQRFTLSELDGKRYEQGFWYAVSEAEAEVLRRQHQNPRDPKTPPAFDIMTAEEADQLMVEETRYALLSTPNARNVVVAPTRDGIEQPRPLTPDEIAEADAAGSETDATAAVANSAASSAPKKRKA